VADIFFFFTLKCVLVLSGKNTIEEADSNTDELKLLICKKRYHRPHTHITQQKGGFFF